MKPDKKLAAACREIMDAMPASIAGQRLPHGGRWKPSFTQKQADIIYAALSHHFIFADIGQHEDSDPGEPVRRLAKHLSLKSKRVHDEMRFDPYEGYSPALREFAEQMDLYTLEEVIIRVLTEIDRRRERYLGGFKAMYERRHKRKAP